MYMVIEQCIICYIQIKVIHILSELKNKDYFIWWGGKNDLIAGQEGYRNHCDIYFEPTNRDFQNGVILNNLVLMVEIIMERT